MKSRLLALMVLASGAAGCVDDRLPVEVYAICAMTDDCTFAATCDANHLGAVGYATGGAMLELALEVHNQAPNNEDIATGRVNSNDAHVTGGSVTYDGTGAPGGWSFFTGNSVVPAEGTSIVWTYPASGAMPVGEFTANLTLSGYFDSGREFETGPFPIGLLVFPAGTTFCPAATPDACPGTGVQSVAACVTP